MCQLVVVVGKTPFFAVWAHLFLDVGLNEQIYANTFLLFKTLELPMISEIIASNKVPIIIVGSIATLPSPLLSWYKTDLTNPPSVYRNTETGGLYTSK